MTILPFIVNSGKLDGCLLWNCRPAVDFEFGKVASHVLEGWVIQMILAVVSSQWAFAGAEAVWSGLRELAVLLGH